MNKGKQHRLWIAGLACLITLSTVLAWLFLVEPIIRHTGQASIVSPVPGTHRERLAGPTCDDDRDLYLCDPPLTGDDVQELQARLAALGFYSGPLNSAFDGPTADSVKSLQKSKGIAPTGRVTGDLWYVLGAGPPVRAAPSPRRPQGTVSMEIDTRKLTLTVLSDGAPHKKYPVAIGKSTTPTPTGEFRVKNKWIEPGGPFGARWMGLNVPWGTYGIHGTNRPYSIGTMASKGCIRMSNGHVSEIYPWINIGTSVTITGAEPYAETARSLKKGDLGTDVQYVQFRVRLLGFDAGQLDGRFGEDLSASVLRIQRFYGLPVTGVVGPDEYHILGIK